MKRLRTPKRIRIPDATALGGDVIEILLSHREDAHGLRNLAEHTIELFNTPTEPTMWRLFQTTYDDDPVAEARYVEKTRGRLIARKREDATRAISVFNTGKPGLASFKIRTDRAHALNVLGFLNDARLIMEPGSTSNRARPDAPRSGASRRPITQIGCREIGISF